THALIDAVGEEKAAIHDRDLGFLVRKEGTVQKDDARHKTLRWRLVECRTGLAPDGWTDQPCGARSGIWRWPSRYERAPILAFPHFCREPSLLLGNDGALAR